MPYSRRRSMRRGFRRRRYPKYRTTRSYSRTRFQRAGRGSALAIRRTTRTAPRRPNIKYLTLAGAENETAVPAAGVFWCLNAMDLATITDVSSTYGNNYRTGTEIHMTGVNVDFTLINAAITGSECRCMILYDRQCNGAAPSIANLFEVSGGLYQYNAPLKVESMDRYQVLYDEVFCLPATSTGADVHRTILLKLNHSTQYIEGSSAGTVADIQTGSLYFVAIGSQYNTTPATDVSLEGVSTLTFMNGNY